MNCRLCNLPNLSSFASAKILNCHNVHFYDCPRCAYVQTEKPYWLEQAYQEPISLTDTGIISRNYDNAFKVLATLVMVGGRTNSQVVDYAGGFGFLVRILRDFGVDAFWYDKYSTNLVARGFEYTKLETPSLVTAFEVFEHFVSPDEELKNMLAFSSNILFSTTLIADPPPLLGSWWYYSLSTGQHIGFYRMSTLKYLAHQHGLRLHSDGKSLHFLTKEIISPFAWRFLIRVARLLPSLFKTGLKSKTWADYSSLEKMYKPYT